MNRDWLAILIAASAGILAVAMVGVLVEAILVRPSP